MLQHFREYFTVGFVSDNASRAIVGFVKGKDNTQLKADLHQLWAELPQVYHLIDQAEWSIDSLPIARLLPCLKDAVYDAEDLIDKFDYYELSLSAEKEKTMLSLDGLQSLVRRINANTFINGKMEVVQRRLDRIVNKIKVNLEKRSGRLTRPETTSFLAEPSIFGREIEVNQLTDMICRSNWKEATLSTKFSTSDKRTRPESTSFLAEPSIGHENEVNQLADVVCGSYWKEATFSTKFSAPDERRKRMRSSTVSVLPIVGLGGVGKTTLAQHIYNDKSEISCFQMRIWVCASNERNMMSLTKKIIRSMGKETPVDDLEYLQSILASQFNNQSFLLVIDDLWDDVFNDNGETWRIFCASLGNYADRSMILVTTRSSKVADAICTIQPFSLLGFQNDVFWDFFKKCVFGSEDPQNNMDNDIELEYIGTSIASKLNGSPLAAKTIGCLLSMNLDTTHWMNIFNTELFDLRQEESGILPALRFSYMHLPYHLKRCFSFCAVYPKGYKFHRPTLVDIWVAQGFVEPQGAMPIASIGNQYFGDLVSRSLFEKVSNSYDEYIIHDLIHDMAYSVAKEECFVIKDSVDFYKVPPNVRHLSIHTSIDVDYQMLRNLCKYKKLRSLLWFSFSSDEYMVSIIETPLSDEYTVSIIETWFNELKKIRVFYTSARFSKLPWNIGYLEHLRYLNFSEANFTELPSSFYRLYKLQFLQAPKSKINDSVKHISKLPNLYKFESNSLQIDEDKIILDAAEDHGRGIRMLKYLRHFHGRLTVHNIGMVSNMADVAEAELNKMVHVTNLVLCWMHYKHCGINAMGSHQYEQNICDADVLQSLCLLTSVKFLSISDYRGTYMPIWQEDAPQLASLDLLYCNQLVSISLNGALSNLTSIRIKVCNKLSSLDGLTPEYFHCIKRICIERCRDLAYLPSETFEGFHSLVELRVVSCPKLKWSRNSVFPCSLRKLYLARCGDISQFISSSLLTLTSLTDLSLVGCMGLTYLHSNLWSKLTALQNLEIQQCEELVSIGGPEATAQIKCVHISGCPKLDLIVQSFSKGKRKMSDIEPLMLEEVQKPEPDDQLVLQRELSHIQGIIELAEWSIHMDRVVKFIQEAKDAMYDTEGLLDELKYNDLLMINGVGQSSLLKFATHSDYPSLKQIKEKVAHLKILMNVMGLHDERQLNISDSMKSKIHPLPKEDKLFGRQEESIKLICKLCSTAAMRDKNQTTTGNVAVLPIVGCGGVGKTSLVQHVFSDKVVQSYFDMAIWISISDDLVEKKLINKFIWSAAEIEMRSDDLASAQRILSSGIIDGSKRFLLVLDNVQEDILGEAKDEFKRLVQLLEHAKQGSKILMTTRSIKVADALGGSDHFLLQGFPEDTLLTFFKMCAFGSDTSNNLRMLDDIGRSIVAKLGTSPLTVKVIGRALSLNLDTEYWRSILESELWEFTQERMDCFSALLLGYCCLPFNLRRCFSFCSLYPKGYEFDKGALVDSWIALGLVEPDGDMLAQDAGNSCFQQLVYRGFFQEAASSSKYVLPGLLHDMARFISKNECYVIKDRSDWQKIPVNVRHLSILGRGVLHGSDLNYLGSHKKLLSLVCYDVEPSVLTPVISSLFCESTRMRMLSFISCQVKELPESIGNLKFLRYLDISACTFDRLPASFWSLHNLEILDARNCSLKELPKDITNLTKLQKFILKDRDHAVPFGDITKVGNLAFLQEMPCFAVEKRQGRGIGELKHMNFLQGKLEISGLMNVTSKDEAAGAELHKKVHLDTLILSWDESVSAFNKQPAGMGMDVLEGLCPNPNLRHLEIKYYMDLEVRASWFQKNKLRSLTSLSFDSCPNLAMLSFKTGDGLSPESSIGFPLLTKLSISRCRRLYSLDEFLQPQLLPAIKVIKIEKCDEIVSLTESFGDFIRLEELELHQCWNLNWQKGLMLPSLLKELKLEACGDISGSTLSCLHNLFTLATFELQFCHQVESIPPEIWSSLQSLENLVIFYCKGLKSIGGSEAIAQIKNVNIAKCPELVDPIQPFLKGTFTPYQSVTCQPNEVDLIDRLQSAQSSFSWLSPSQPASHLPGERGGSD